MEHNLIDIKLLMAQTSTAFYNVVIKRGVHGKHNYLQTAVKFVEIFWI